MVATGHSLIKAKLAETGAPLAGEMSGHIFFADALLRLRRRDLCRGAAARTSSPRSRESLAEMRDQLPAVVNTPELRFACAEDAQIRGRRRGPRTAAPSAAPR